MSSLSRFKKKLRGDLSEKTEPNFEDQSILVDEETIDQEDNLMIEPESMTKAELDTYAIGQHGIQLDRRQTKLNMITEFIQKLKEKN